MSDLKIFIPMLSYFFDLKNAQALSSLALQLHRALSRAVFLYFNSNNKADCQIRK